MSREIKFRVWDIPNGEWLVESKTDGMFHTPDNGAKSTLQWCVESEDFDVQQYTGLLDKAGKEIYEGDICDFRMYEHLDGSRRWHRGFILWNDKEGRWRLRSYYPAFVGDRTKDGFYGTGLSIIDEIEVIGNIRENPELLTP